MILNKPTIPTVTGGTCTNQVVTVISSSAVPTCTTVTSAYVSNTIALTGGDINTSSQVVATHLTSPLPVAQGGTGTTTPGLVAGTNVTITGTWPNQTINSTGGGSGVTSVSGTSPIASSGGTTPAISCATCVTSAAALTAQQPLQGNGSQAATTTGGAILYNNSSNLQTTMCALGSAGGTVIVNTSITLSYNVDPSTCGSPPAAVNIIKQKGVTICANTGCGAGSNYTILHSAPLVSYASSGVGQLNTNEERFNYDSAYMCLDYNNSYPTCSPSGQRLIDMPFVVHGRSSVDFGVSQQDAAMIVTRGTTDSIENSTCVLDNGCNEARSTLVVNTDYGDGVTSVNGTTYGFLSTMQVRNSTANKGNIAIGGYYQDSGGATSSVLNINGGQALFGQTNCSNGNSSCTGVSVESNGDTGYTGTMSGVLINDTGTTSALFQSFGIFGQFAYANPLATVTDLVTNGTYTVTSASNPFNSGMVNSYIHIGGKGTYRVASYTNSSTIVLSAIPGWNSGAPSSGTGQTAYVGVNPGFGAYLKNGQGHQMGQLLITDQGTGTNDFFNAAFATTTTAQNIVQLINAPGPFGSPPAPSAAGYDNRIQFWRGLAGDAGQGTPMVAGQTGLQTATLVADIMSGDSQSATFDMYVRKLDVQTLIVRLSPDGFVLSNIPTSCSGHATGTVYNTGTSATGGGTALGICP